MSRRKNPKGGRPPRLVEPHVRNRLITAFRHGMSIDAACAAAGIAPKTFYNWANRAAAELDRLSELATPEKPTPEPRPEEWPFVQLLQDVSRVRAERQERMLAIVDKVARGGILVQEREEHTSEGGYIVTRTYSQPNWKAAQWWIERAFPNQFGRAATKHMIEVTSPDGSVPTGAGGVSSGVVLSSLAERLAASYALQAADRAELTSGEEEPVDAEIVEEEATVP